MKNLETVNYSVLANIMYPADMRKLGIDWARFRDAG